MTLSPVESSIIKGRAYCCVASTSTCENKCVRAGAAVFAAGGLLILGLGVSAGVLNTSLNTFARVATIASSLLGGTAAVVYGVMVYRLSEPCCSPRDESSEA